MIPRRSGDIRRPWPGIILIRRSRTGLVLFATLFGMIICSTPCAEAQWLAMLPDPGECTIGVAAGRATADGRPLLWKIRDASEEENEVRFLTAGGLYYLAVVNAGGSSPWMAVNERGFALVNANSLDLPGTDNSGNGSFMRLAMSTCASVADFRRLLDSTNETGRRTQAHFAVLDTAGAAALFETGGSQYWMFDACDSALTPAGYVIRTNFALNGGGTTGLTRFRRSTAIIGHLAGKDSLSLTGLLSLHMRDMADPWGNPYLIPYPGRYAPHLPVGYVPTALSISRSGSVSAAVIEGTAQGEPARLTTLWAMLGQPAAAVLLPYWPVGPTPPESHGTGGAPLCREAQRIESGLFRFIENPSGGARTEYLNSYRLSDGRGHGVWHRLLPAEASAVAQTREMMDRWRLDPPDPYLMLDEEARLAARAREVLRSIEPAPQADEEPAPTEYALLQNYPNPFNAGTRIPFALPAHGRVRITLYDLLGRQVRVLADESMEAGVHEIAADFSALPSGFYVYRMVAETGGPGERPERVVLNRKLMIVR